MNTTRILRRLIVAAGCWLALAGTHHVQPKPGEPLANQLFGAKKRPRTRNPR